MLPQPFWLKRRVTSVSPWRQHEQSPSERLQRPGASSRMCAGSFEPRPARAGAWRKSRSLLNRSMTGTSAGSCSRGRTTTPKEWFGTPSGITSVWKPRPIRRMQTTIGVRADRGSSLKKFFFHYKKFFFIIKTQVKFKKIYEI